MIGTCSGIFESKFGSKCKIHDKHIGNFLEMNLSAVV